MLIVIVHKGQSRGIRRKRYPRPRMMMVPLILAHSGHSHSKQGMICQLVPLTADHRIRADHVWPKLARDVLLTVSPAIPGVRGWITQTSKGKISLDLQEKDIVIRRRLRTSISVFCLTIWPVLVLNTSWMTGHGF